MDDYFKLPPKSNHENRQKSLKNVGVHEVYLDKIQETVKSLKKENLSSRNPLFIILKILSPKRFLKQKIFRFLLLKELMCWISMILMSVFSLTVLIKIPMKTG